MGCRILLPIAFLLSTFVFLSCQPEEKDYSKELIGHWDVTQAKREGKITSTLEEAYFEFSSKDEMILNLSGLPQRAKYSLNGSSFSVTGTNMDAEYNIENLNGDSMVVTADILGKEFEFSLVKAQ
ncbi:MAG: hypothetical protein R2879_00400 [Saprospiraceae bacterium]|jgi:hypothetical protein